MTINWDYSSSGPKRANIVVFSVTFSLFYFYGKILNFPTIWFRIVLLM